MNHSHDGLSIWYGTPDAPAPFDKEIVPRRGVSLVVGANPANPLNTLLVRYRVDAGPEQTVPGRELRTDYDRNAQYFLVTFPPFPTGNTVEYFPSLSCAGRQVPPPYRIDRRGSTFCLANEVTAPIPRKPLEPPRVGRFGVGLQLVASVSIQFDPIQFIGETPAGMRVNFFVREGTVEGNGFRGKVTAGSSDQMIIRRDGVGVVRVRGAFEMADGVRLDVESGGYADFGPDGYRRAVAHDLADRVPLVLTPVISTEHPKFRWLSRVQCIGVGETRLDAGQVFYDAYAASSRVEVAP